MPKPSRFRRRVAKVEEPRPWPTREEMAVRAEEASRLAKELGGLTDEMNSFIKRAEAVFVKVGLDVEATVPLTLPEEPVRGRPRRDKKTYALTFRMYRGSWRLLVESCDAKSRRVTEETLTTSSRLIRLGGLKAIPDLHKALEAETAQHSA